MMSVIYQLNHPGMIPSQQARALLKECFPEAALTLGEYLTTGGQGSIYTVHAPEGDQVCKFIDTADASPDRAEVLRQTAETELEVLRQLAEQKAAHSVRFIAAAWSKSGRFCLIREQQLTSLNSYIKAELQRYPMEAVAARIGYDLSLGLDELHAQGWIHRDVRKENVCVYCSGTGRNVTMLCDFGSATRVNTPPLFYSESGKSTPPEGRSNGQEDASLPMPTPQFDLYSLGVLMEGLLARKSCSKAMRKLIADCKAELPEARPTTEELRRVLGAILLDYAAKHDGKKRPVQPVVQSMAQAVELWCNQGEKAKRSILAYADTEAPGEGARWFLHALVQPEDARARLQALKNSARAGYTLGGYYYGLELCRESAYCTDAKKAAALREAGQRWFVWAAKRGYAPAQLALEALASGKPDVYEETYPKQRAAALREQL